MRRKRRHLHTIQPLSFQKPPLFKSLLFWISVAVALSLAVAVFIY